ncbi:MAG: right-handed parallel beta-helix repeat-containing protein [Clostridia bacterium]|nr:right-handed parallel beta-helix repeat-containing protein [Clostridia bacterium]
MFYHVAKNGNDKNAGTEKSPFLTINRAAQVADEGDTVVVHEGVYRETVRPAHGARSESGRITYTVADGEKVIIKGSEVVSGWVRRGEVWQARVQNALFGGFNPYAELLDGDWLARPLDPVTGLGMRHLGTVYVDGEALTEALTFDELKATPMSWLANVEAESTEIWANFGTKDAENSEIEINVRKTCFYPEYTGVNYVTVRGFELCHAATPWAPPTVEQFGALGVNWAKGWVIENNVIHDARCCGLSVGKNFSFEQNAYTKYRRKGAMCYQFEAMFRGAREGWCREKVGSHIIRNNVIYNCGQSGIVGHMGGAFSEIYGNEIYNIGMHDEFWGYERGAIKLHAPIDTYIHHNHMHHCAMGTWLDWQAQGTRLSCNLFHDNEIDVKIEVTHGPHIVDNNILGSAQGLQNAAQGGAYVNNIFLGGMYKYEVLDRATPYHLAHSTEFAGCTLVYGADDRFYNNIFANIQTEENKKFIPGLPMYEGCADSLEEYIETVWQHYGKCDVENYAKIPQPVYTANNYYGDGVVPYERDTASAVSALATEAKIVEEADGVYLEITLDSSFGALAPEVITTEKLGLPRITECPYDAPDGSRVVINTDILGEKLPAVGALAALHAGKNRVRVWKK